MIVSFHFVLSFQYSFLLCLVFTFQFGGHIFGCVDREGTMSGKDFIYAYPNETTFLKGTFKVSDVSSPVAHCTFVGILKIEEILLLKEDFFVIKGWRHD